MKSEFRLWAGGLFVCMVLASCQKEITVDLPPAEPKIVVEGSIEQGFPPIVMLTWSQGYFEPTSLSSIENSFIKDAVVKVSNGTDTVQLGLICAQDLSPEELELAAEVLGFDPASLATFNLCIYTTFDESVWGETGKTYTLWVEKDEHRLRAQTKINELVYIDSLWFTIPNEEPGDSLGFIFGTIEDPDTLGNAYRWFAKRINRYPNWVPATNLRGQPKDPIFIAPIGSVFDDQFFNGLSFEFGYYRGQQPNSAKFDDENEERGYFKRGDTVVVRGCVIDRGVFRFISSFESQVANLGSPFAVPNNIETNVTGGGLGLWAGYGAIYDTVVCQ